MKKSILGTFKSSFDDKCFIGNCKGWGTEGEYYTQTKANGDVELDVRVNVHAPHHMESVINKASFYISNGIKGAPTVVPTVDNQVDNKTV